MKHTKEEMRADLKALGIKAGDTLLMHSSFKALGGIEGDAAGVFEVLLDVLGPEGTLVLPALSYESVTLQRPFFDVRETPSCIGWLPEYFRTSVPGVKRSLHATHSCCAVGKNADALLRGHCLDVTPVGQNSPFAKLPLCGGKILMLGCHPNHNTSMHGVEETAEPPYLFNRDVHAEYLLRDYDGSEHKVTSLRHWFGEGHRYSQQYARIMNYLEDGELYNGKILDADCVLMDAAAVWKHGKEALLKDPYSFVENTMA